MKLSDSDRIALLHGITQALIPLKIMKTPPASDGTQKPGSWSWSTACWAKEHLRTLEKVLETYGEEPPATGSTAGPAHEEERAPF